MVTQRLVALCYWHVGDGLFLKRGVVEKRHAYEFVYLGDSSRPVEVLDVLDDALLGCAVTSRDA